MTTEEELNQTLEKFPNKKGYRVLTTGNLTMPEFCSGNRLNMFANQLSQIVPLISPESPLFATSFEKPYGKYTDSYMVSPADFRVIAVIPKFVNISRFNYLYVVQNMITKVYDVIEMKHYEILSEDRGYLRPYTDGDKYKVGDIIRKGSTLYRSDSHDEYGNYRYGINCNVVYISRPETEEDGIAIRAGFRERFSFYDCIKTPILLNKNQKLLNIYGDQNTYRCFPDIGQYVKDGILFARRNINYANIAAECSDNELTHILTSDEVCRGGGVVGDIDIWINDREELIDSASNQQLAMYYRALVEYYTKVYNVLNPIVNARSRDNVQYTNMLGWIYNHAVNYLDKNVLWVNNNNTIEFAYIEIFTYEKKYATDGYKLTDRFGGKGVITHVIPDEEMPRDEYGNVADLILSPPGTVGRANNGQNYEQEFNFIASEVAKRVVRFAGTPKADNLIVDFISTFNPDEGRSLVTWLSKASIDKKSRFYNDISKYGIEMIKEPFDGNVTPEKLELMYNKFNVRPGYISSCCEFKDTFTSMPLANSPDANVIKGSEDLGNYVVPGLDTDTNMRQINSFVGVTPYDIEKGEKYVKTPLSVTPIGQNRYITDNINKNIIDLKSAKPGSCIEAWINSEGNLVRRYKSMKPVIIGKKYYMLLKQMPDEKFSARSVGSTSQVGIPNKTGKQSKLMSPYAKNAIRLSEMDNDVNFVRIDPEIENRFMATHSVNPTLCEALSSMLLWEDPFEVHDLPIENTEIVDNVPALMFHSILYSMCGIETSDIREGDNLKPLY